MMHRSKKLFSYSAVRYFMSYQGTYKSLKCSILGKKPNAIVAMLGGARCAVFALAGGAIAGLVCLI